MRSIIQEEKKEEEILLIAEGSRASGILFGRSPCCLGIFLIVHLTGKPINKANNNTKRSFFQKSGRLSKGLNL